MQTKQEISKNKYKCVLVLIGMSFILEIIIGVRILLIPLTEYNIYYAFLSLMLIVGIFLSWYFFDKLSRIEVKDD